MIDDIRRPGKRNNLQPTKIDAQIFRPGQQEIESASEPTLPTKSIPLDINNQPTTEAPAQDTPKKLDIASFVPVAGDSKPPKQPRKVFWSNWSKKKKIISLAILIVVVLVGSALAAWQLTKSEPEAPVKKVTVKKVAPPPVYYSNLSGLQISDPTINDRPVTGVMIENSPDSRPQSGIDQASIVYEAIAEGGITRFLTLYQDTQPDYIGPVRSARPYYVQWARGYDAGYAHVGGSPEALANIKAWGIKDLDQFYNSGSYQRISSRFAPHNVYSSVPTLTQLQISKGWTKSTYIGFDRKSDAPAKAPTAAKVDISISSPLYNSHYDYDAASNSYVRSQGGAAHTAVNKDGTQVPIKPKVVVAMVTSYAIQADGKHSEYNVVGSGAGVIFQDGIATSVTWKKDSLEGPVTFVDAAGKVVKINRGQTWITVVSGPEKIVYTP